MSVAYASVEFSAIAQDPPKDPLYPAGMHPLAIPSHGETLHGAFYRAAGVPPRGTVIVLHGLPGFDQNTDITHTIRRAGFHALVFHYRGAWGSSGTFSLRHALEDTRACIAYLRSAEVAAELGVDSERLILIGHSMGGAIAGLAAASDRRIAGVGMISPWNMGAPASSRTNLFNRHLREALNEDARALACKDGEALYDEAERHANWNLVDYAGTWRGRPVLVVTSNDLFMHQGMNVAQACRNAKHAGLMDVHLDSDHVYSDSRIALQEHILSWLQRIESPWQACDASSALVAVTRAEPMALQREA